MVTGIDVGEHGASGWVLLVWWECGFKFAVNEASSKEMTDNKIDMNANYDVRTEEDTSDKNIVCCYPQRVKFYHGRYNRHKTKTEKVAQKYQK